MNNIDQIYQAREQLDRILEKIPTSGSFEAARLAQEASRLTDTIAELCAHPDEIKVVERKEQNAEEKAAI